MICMATLVASKEPILSYSKIDGLVRSSISLSVDTVKYGSIKFEEALPEEPRKIYAKFTNNLKAYTNMVSNAYATSPVKGGVETVIGIVWNFLAGRYARFNELNHRYITPIVSDFEQRFSTSKGLIGEELVDRALVVAWLWYAIKFVVKYITSKLFGRMVIRRK